MDENQRQEAVQQGKMSTENFVMKSTDPNMKTKIATNITDPGGTVYWYIRFNTPLDEETVSRRTMNVTDTTGYILHTLITYDASRNLIVLNPMDLYRQNEYYILHISKKVRSAKGRPLPKNVYIMFKLVGEQISEFHMLKEASVPKPMEKTKAMRKAEQAELAEAIAKVSEGAKPPKEKTSKPAKPAHPTVPYGPIGIKLHFAFIGLMLMLGSLMTQTVGIILGGMGAALLGLGHIIFQMTKKPTMSAINYNLGAHNFNKQAYDKAVKFFEKSKTQDPGNKLPKSALTKAQRHIKTN
ncbi:MAG: hypothetical protein FWB98_08455 [Defluviitaleaceae bacterium]|nr:hypothetical protein [Defluviitaleaceae bacterium]